MRDYAEGVEYIRLYREGVEALKDAGVAEAELDARLLLEYVCGTNRNDMYMYPDRPVEAAQCNKFSELICKRRLRIPLQHLTGVQEFMGLEFDVNKHVLIPRQDTENLVEEVLRHLHDGMSILDMCTGSGCILLSLLHYSNDCVGVGVDLSQEALEVARSNASKLGLKATFIQSDLFENVSGKFDIIVSNPPYIQSAVIPTLEEEVKAHEPMMALDGSEDGLLFYRRISRDAKGYLTRGGMLFFEIGHDEREDVCAILEKEGYGEIRAMKDFAGNDRVVYATFVE